jgi:dTDP-4-dehydrorhamnose reductase
VKILLTGRNGQVGWELERALPALGEVIATDRTTLDLADPDAIRRVVRETKPDVIVNAAAYTAVDKAESETELAMRINGVAPGIFAEEARRLDALLVHYSTDYVFDGAKRRAYVEDDKPHPLNVYGRSKLGGEDAIHAAGVRYLIFRTSWVYSHRGNNFFRTMVRLAGEKKELRVVDDQVGAPTTSATVAASTLAILKLVRESATSELGTFHLTANGKTSWYGFAKAIVDILGMTTDVVPIKSAEYATTARRPSNSVLDNSKLKLHYSVVQAGWRAGLEDVIRAMRASASR